MLAKKNIGNFRTSMNLLQNLATDVQVEVFTLIYVFRR